MPKLEELLRDTVTTTDRASPAGVLDLNRAVAELNDATRKLTEGELSVYLKKIMSSLGATTYELYVEYRGDDARTLARYALPVGGYPVTVYRTVFLDPDSPESGPTETLNSAQELEAHFERMVTDPTEPLVRYVAFARQQMREDRQLDEQPEG